MCKGWFRWNMLGCLVAVATLAWVAPVFGQEAAVADAVAVVEAEVEEVAGISDEMFAINNLWIMLAGCLVFIMHLGFAMLEAGLTRAKNTVNILFKNTMIICIGLLLYGFIGFNMMYPEEWMIEGVFGFGWGITVPEGDPEGLLTSAYDEGYTWYTDFFFQAMFAATCATIVSGAVAGRIKLSAFLVFTALFVGIGYNITGSWTWGGGWLDELGFVDFAGSTIVHSVGGWGALMGALILGPRLGKYAKDGSIQPIPGHSLPLATIGVFFLWFGWFGFNGGSVLSANPAEVSLVLVTTALAAAAGGFVTAMVSWVFGGKPDLSMALNGVLAGLVGITAGADLMAVWEAVVIGGIAGVIVYFAVLGFDKIRIDDPVGAVSVHLVCGIWGTLAVGIFGAEAGLNQLMLQVIGIVAMGAFAAGFTAIVFLGIKFTMGLRVSEAEEIEGLDLGEHDMSAYPDFQRTYIKSYHAREI
jgi:Amt family ammonium transporter